VAAEDSRNSGLAVQRCAGMRQPASLLGHGRTSQRTLLSCHMHTTLQDATIRLKWSMHIRSDVLSAHYSVAKVQ
jgi:hypothetical protein